MLEAFIGDSKTWRFTFTDEGGAPYPLSAADQIVATARYLRARGPILFQRKNTAAGGGDSQVEIVDGPNGVVDVKVGATETALLSPGEIDFEVVAKLASDGGERTLYRSVLRAHRRVTPALP